MGGNSIVYYKDNSYETMISKFEIKCTLKIEY